MSRRRGVNPLRALRAGVANLLAERLPEHWWVRLPMPVRVWVYLNATV